MFTFSINTVKEEEIVDITPEVNSLIKKSKVKSGLCLVFALHATASVIINENADPNILLDFQRSLRRIIPKHDNYLHDSIDNNAHAHLKSSLLGPAQVIPVNDNSLLLGTWQSVMLCEFDGPRNRTVCVVVVPDN